MAGRNPGPQGRCDEGIRQEADGRHRGHRKDHLADTGAPEWTRLRHAHWQPHREGKRMEGARRLRPQLPQ
eukprot:4721335-Heterocapsa_arctica.AAC.1